MRYKSSDYVYVSAYVRSKERRLLDSKGISRMVAAKSVQEALRVLGDFGYAIEEGFRGSEGGMERLLSFELAEAYRNVLQMLPDRNALNALLIQYDYQNIKALIKGEMAGVDPSDSLVDIGTIPKETLVRVIKERDFLMLSFHMKSAIEYALETFAKSKDPQHIDFILDRACYLEMKIAAEETGCQYLIDYITLLIDTINIKTFVRIREMKRDWVAFNRVFLPGGDIAESVFVAGFDEEYVQFAERLRSYHNFEEVMAKGGKQLADTGRFTELERLCDNAIMDYAIRARYVSAGLEIPVAYLIAMEGEIRLIRIILAAIEQGLAPEQLDARMRRIYV